MARVEWLLLAAAAVLLAAAGCGDDGDLRPTGPGAGESLTVDLHGGGQMELVGIPAGRFLMGSPASEAGRGEDEGPQREVRISRGFWLGVYEITQAQWEEVMGTRRGRVRTAW